MTMEYWNGTNNPDRVRVRKRSSSGNWSATSYDILSTTRRLSFPSAAYGGSSSNRLGVATDAILAVTNTSNINFYLFESNSLALLQSYEIDDDFDDDRRPYLISDEDGNSTWFYVSYQESSKITIKRTTDFGASWTLLKEYTGISTPIRNSCLAVDRTNISQIYLAYTANGSLYVAKGTSYGTVWWNTPLLISSNNLELCSIAAAGNSVVILAQKVYSSTDVDPWYWYSTDGGSSWSAQIPLTQALTYDGLGRVIAAPNGSIFYSAYRKGNHTGTDNSIVLVSMPSGNLDDYTEYSTDATSNISDDDFVSISASSSSFATLNPLVGYVKLVGSDYDVYYYYPPPPGAEDWSDGFESYTTGTFPSTWTPDANAVSDPNNNKVTTAVAHTGEKSLQLHGVVTGCWGALAYRALSVSPLYEIEVAVYNGNEPLSGCHPERAGLGIRQGFSWQNPAREFILFRGNGTITSAAGNVLQTYTPLTWYTVRIRYERPSSSQVRIVYWINGVYKGEETLTADPDEDQMTNLEINAQEGTVGFDDIFLTPIVNSVDLINNELPIDYQLYQNYPNPFNPSTTIRFALKERSHVKLVVFDVLGQNVASLVDEELNAGAYETQFYPGNLASGFYIYRLTANGFVQSRRMLFVK